MPFFSNSIKPKENNAEIQQQESLKAKPLSLGKLEEKLKVEQKKKSKTPDRAANQRNNQKKDAIKDAIEELLAAISRKKKSNPKTEKEIALKNFLELHNDLLFTESKINTEALYFLKRQPADAIKALNKFLGVAKFKELFLSDSNLRFAILTEDANGYGKAFFIDRLNEFLKEDHLMALFKDSNAKAGEDLRYFLLGDVAQRIKDQKDFAHLPNSESDNVFPSENTFLAKRARKHVSLLKTFLEHPSRSKLFCSDDDVGQQLRNLLLNKKAEVKKATEFINGVPLNYRIIQLITLFSVPSFDKMFVSDTNIGQQLRGLLLNNNHAYDEIEQLKKLLLEKSFNEMFVSNTNIGQQIRNYLSSDEQDKIIDYHKLRDLSDLLQELKHNIIDTNKLSEEDAKTFFIFLGYEGDVTRLDAARLFFLLLDDSPKAELLERRPENLELVEMCLSSEDEIKSEFLRQLSTRDMIEITKCKDNGNPSKDQIWSWFKGARNKPEVNTYINRLIKSKILENEKFRTEALNDIGKLKPEYCEGMDDSFVDSLLKEQPKESELTKEEYTKELAGRSELTKELHKLGLFETFRGQLNKAEKQADKALAMNIATDLLEDINKKRLLLLPQASELTTLHLALSNKDLSVNGLMKLDYSLLEAFNSAKMNDCYNDQLIGFCEKPTQKEGKKYSKTYINLLAPEWECLGKSMAKDGIITKLLIAYYEKGEENPEFIETLKEIPNVPELHELLKIKTHIAATTGSFKEESADLLSGLVEILKIAVNSKDINDSELKAAVAGLDATQGFECLGVIGKIFESLALPDRDNTKMNKDDVYKLELLNKAKKLIKVDKSKEKTNKSNKEQTDKKIRPDNTPLTDRFMNEIVSGI